MAKEREAKGGGYCARGKHFARVTDRPGHRVGVILPWCTNLDDAKTRGVALQAMVNLLREAGQGTWIEKTIEVGGPADALDLAELEAHVAGIVKGKIAKKAEASKDGPATFAKFAERWTNGELRRLYPDHLRVKKSVKDDEYRLELLNEIVGEVPLSRFALDDAERAMRDL